MGEGHKHPGWRVIIDEKTTPRIVKNLLSVNIGKLHLAEVRPIVQPVDNPSSIITTASDLIHRASPQRESLASSPQQSDDLNMLGGMFFFCCHRIQHFSDVDRFVLEEHQMLIPEGDYEFEDITSEQELAHKLMKDQQRSKAFDGAGTSRSSSAAPKPTPAPVSVPPVDPFAGMFGSGAGTGAPAPGQAAPKNVPRGGLLPVDMVALSSSEANGPDKMNNTKGDKNNAKGKRRGGRKKSGNQRNKRDKPVIVLDGPNIAMVRISIPPLFQYHHIN